MATATLAATLTYTPPGGVVNSGINQLGLTPAYTVMSAAVLDVPPATGSGTIYVVPFGTVSIPKLIIFKNKVGQELGVRFNGAVASHFNLPVNGEIIFGAPSAPVGTPITQIHLVTTAIQGGTLGQIETFVFGDA